jgi:hypothetical protein
LQLPPRTSLKGRCISKLLVILLNYRVLTVAESQRGHGN